MTSVAPFKHIPLAFRSGIHEGKTVEWVIFHDPGWILNCKCFDSQEGGYGAIGRRVDLLWRRATNLRIPGMCYWCKKQPIARIVLSQGGNYISSVSFACDKCQPVAIQRPIPCPASFEAVRYCHSKSDVKTLVDAIKWQYVALRSVRLNQKHLEEFFENSSNFAVSN